MDLHPPLERWLCHHRALLRRARRHGRRGMSLVEVMVVLAIILTLMSILAFGVMNAFVTSQVDTTALSMGKVSERIEIYTLRHEHPPSTSDGLAAVYVAEDVPTDSWGNAYVYVSPGPNGLPWDLISYGADGVEGGTGNDADLKWSDRYPHRGS